MTKKDLLKRIEKLDFLTINKMSPEVLKNLTMEFSEFMVRKVLARGKTNSQQREIIKTIKKDYSEWKKNTDMMWGALPQLKVYPEYMEEWQMDIECGIMITDENETDELEERMDDYMERHTMTPEDIDNAISEDDSNTFTKEKSSDTVAALKERIKKLEEENKGLKEQLDHQPAVINTVDKTDEKKWIGCFDSFLDPRLNAEAIAKKLYEITSPHLPKYERSFWWVVFTVFSEIHWISNQSNNHKTILQWANLHFDCGWDWKKANQFKFSDINKKIKAKNSSEWNNHLTGNVIGDYYGELAKNIKESFVEIIDGKIIDRGCFILTGCQRINSGR